MGKKPNTPAEIEERLGQLRRQLAALNEGGFTAQLVKHFPLGSVGGSGRNVPRLNARRERDLESTIKKAKRALQVEAEIKQLEARLSGGQTPAPQRRAARKAPRPRRVLTWDDIGERCYTIWRWSMYGTTRDTPPFSDLTDEEVNRVARRSMPAATEDDPDWVKAVRQRYPADTYAWD